MSGEKKRYVSVEEQEWQKFKLEVDYWVNGRLSQYEQQLSQKFKLLLCSLGKFYYVSHNELKT